MGNKGSSFIERVKLELATAFKIADMGSISFYLGLKVERNQAKKTLKLLQPAYIDKILVKYYFNQAIPYNTLMKEGISLLIKSSEASQTEQEQYQDMTRSLIFSIVEIRPDIAFATSVISRFAKNPSCQYIKIIKTIMQYLKATCTLSIIYGRDGEDLIIKSFSNSHWTGNYPSRKSTSRFIFMLNGSPVS